MATLACTVEVCKKTGVIVKVEDADAGSIQTIEIAGDRIVLRVEGKGGTSTVVQTADEVSITCKKFQVAAEEVAIEGKSGPVEVTSGGDMTLTAEEGKVAARGKDVDVTARAALTLESETATAAVKGKDVEVTARGKLTASGMSTAIEGKVKLDVKASGPAALQGAVTNIKSSGVTSVQ